MRNTKISKPELERALVLIEEGTSVTAICKRYHMTRTTFYRSLERHGLYAPTLRRGPLTTSEIYYIREELKAGAKIVDILRKWGIKRATLYKYIKRPIKGNQGDTDSVE